MGRATMGNETDAADAKMPEGPVAFRKEWGAALGRDDDRVFFRALKTVSPGREGKSRETPDKRVPDGYVARASYLRLHVAGMALKIITGAPFAQIRRRNNNGFAGVAAGREYVEKEA